MKEQDKLLSEINKRIDNVRKGKISQVIVKDEGHGHITIQIKTPPLYDEPKQESIFERVLRYLRG